jgi:hypothetical protein
MIVEVDKKKEKKDNMGAMPHQKQMGRLDQSMNANMHNPIVMILMVVT